MYQSSMDPFWDEEYKTLDYTKQPFNDNDMMKLWKKQGYNQKYVVGEMCDMRKHQPTWNQKIIDHFSSWQDVGTSYYRMQTATIMPEHKDTYDLYKKLHNLTHGETIMRAVVFLEDRKQGHAFEISGEFMNWKAGDYVVWQNDAPHAAANLGVEDRYTLQVTGWKK